MAWWFGALWLGDGKHGCVYPFLRQGSLYYLTADMVFEQKLEIRLGHRRDRKSHPGGRFLTLS